MANRIDSFSGAHRFLSNFWPAQVALKGFAYPTVEHAYQAAKSLSQEHRAMIRTCRTPGDAKRLGKKIVVRSDWDLVKLSVMTLLVTQKFFAHEDCRDLLLATGDAELIEGNHWGDTFWGVCRGEGQNHLGKIIMTVRDELKK